MSRGTLVYATQRLVLITFTAIVVSSIVFIGVHQLPGNALASERRLNPETEKALLHHYNLDLPWPQQYLLWLQGLRWACPSVRAPELALTPLHRRAQLVRSPLCIRNDARRTCLRTLHP